MQAVLFNKDTRQVINILVDANSIIDKVVHANIHTLDYSNEQNIDCILTNNNYTIGDVLPVVITEPPTAEQRIAELENTILRLLEVL